MSGQIHYREFGSGSPLVLIHGDFNDGPSAWSRQLESLAAHHRLIVVDRRGHGASPRDPRPYTFASDAADVLAVADRAGAAGFHLAGHSYGGLVAIEVARRAPARVRSLHLLEPPYLSLLPDPPEVAPLIARGMEIQRLATTAEPHETAETFFAMLAGNAGMERLRSSSGWPSVVREAGRLGDAEYASLYPSSALDDLKLAVPVKIYSGGRSHPGLQAVARRLTELIPGSELVVLPDATHAVQYAGEPFDRELLAVTRERQHLLIDCDDTLWENNVYFERAIDQFLDFLDHSTLTREEARAALDEIERANAGIHGYGARAFARSLRECYEHLAERDLDEEEIRTVMRFGERILEQEIEVLPGVEQTLAELSSRHDLVAFTMGHHEEQRLKIDRSGICHYFRHHAIVAEKNEESYRELIAQLGYDPARSWMIGNSPKSDINSALAAGLGAVFIPHDMTWRLEFADVNHSGERYLVLERFSQLLDHF
jgi:putative hydrolase of the HAD superfamily